MDIFDLVGEAILACDHELSLMVTWNFARTFNVYLVDGTELSSVDCFSSQEEISRWEAAEMADKHLEQLRSE